MKANTLFYRLCQLFPELLFELIGEDPSQAAKYKVCSREIARLARRFDGVFIPNSSDDFNDLLYLVEVQFQGKEDFYPKLFAEAFTYMEQYKPKNDWRFVAIFAYRNLESEFSQHYLGLKPLVQVVYLDEISREDSPSISLSILKLMLIPPEYVQEELPGLLKKLSQQITDQSRNEEVIDFIDEVIFYKFINLSRQEVGAIFSLEDVRETVLYKDARAEGEHLAKLKAVSKLSALGLTIEQISQALDLQISIVERVIAGEDINSEPMLRGYFWD